MPTINEITTGAPESEESSLQISSTSPEQLVPSVPSRALHVKKSSTKQSATESSSRSSSQGSRPPTGRSSREITHRGPGSIHSQDQRSYSKHRQGQNIVLQDQRTFVHDQDQRQLQVTVRVDPDGVVARETEIMSQAHVAVSEARGREFQIRSEASAIVSAARSQLESEPHAMQTQGEVLQQ